MSTTTDPAKGTSKTTNPEEKKTTKKTEEKTINENKADSKTAAAIQVAQPKMVFANRPISPSNLVVVDTMNQSGIRPIVATSLNIQDTLYASGARPITSSTLAITGMLTQNRPIASNVIDDYEILMGYLD